MTKITNFFKTSWMTSAGLLVVMCCIVYSPFFHNFFIWDDDEDYKNSKRGISGCMSRVDDLLEGKSILIELEESMYCIGIESKLNKVEVDYMKYKIDLMKG